MKKVSLFLAMVFAVTFAMAQNTATTEQYGDSNDATVTQSSTGNTATVFQGSASQDVNDAEAIIDQQSASNTATIWQGTNIVADEAWSKITQKAGDENTAVIKQVRYTHGNGDKWGKPKENEAEVYQEGASNEAYITTEAERGNSEVIQVGSDNYAVILTDMERDAEAYINQEGSNNKADVHQFGDANAYVDIDQLGDWNEAYVDQTGGGETTIMQDGDYNVVDFKQTGNSAYADIVQEGNNNTVMGLGTDPVATSLNSSWLDVDQLGDGNTLHLQQTNGASATVMQDGMTNTSVIIQN